jgi:hypothetical protein
VKQGTKKTLCKFKSLSLFFSRTIGLLCRHGRTASYALRLRTMARKLNWIPGSLGLSGTFGPMCWHGGAGGELQLEVAIYIGN